MGAVLFVISVILLLVGAGHLSVAEMAHSHRHIVASRTPRVMTCLFAGFMGCIGIVLILGAVGAAVDAVIQSGVSAAGALLLGAGVLAGLLAGAVPLVAAVFMVRIARLLGKEATGIRGRKIGSSADLVTALGYVWIGFAVLSGGPLFLVVGLFLVIRLSAQRDALLWTLAIAASKEMPLGPAVRAYAEQCGFIARRRVLDMADRLDAGMSLPDVLETVPRLVPKSALVAARVGWDCGRLGPALREFVAGRTLRKPYWHVLAARLYYLVAVALVIQAITGFILYFIIPKFKKIFYDFGVELPEPALIVLRWSDRMVQSGAASLFSLAELALSWYFVWAYMGWGRFVPLMDRLMRRADAAPILRALATCTECGLPISQSFSLLAACHPKPGIRARLESAAMAASTGEEWTECLRHERLLDATEVAVLRAAERVGNVAWALREMAEGGERRLGYQLQMWSQIAFFFVVLAVAGLVGLLAVGFFSPLIKLISELSG